MQTNERFYVTPRLVFGVGILILGLLWTLDNVNILESERYTDWWPVIIMAMGAVRLLDPRAGKVGSVVLMVIGTGLLLDSLDFMHFDFGDLIPLGIAALGAKLIWDAISRKRPQPASTDDPQAEVHAFALMGGLHTRVTSKDFRGGDANAIMGGVELDLRDAHVNDGDEVRIDAFAFWGGVEITVPNNWRVTNKVLPLMGGFDDATKPSGLPGPTLVVSGAAIMGAIEVKN
jgi:hypothetical protein